MAEACVEACDEVERLGLERPLQPVELRKEIEFAGKYPGMFLTFSKEHQMSEIRVGSIVHLRSGGSLMTVEKISVLAGGESIHCVWWSGNDAVRGGFTRESLKLAKEQR